MDDMSTIVIKKCFWNGSINIEYIFMQLAKHI